MENEGDALDANQPFQELFLKELLVDAGLESQRRPQHRRRRPPEEKREEKREDIQKSMTIQELLNLIPIGCPGELQGEVEDFTLEPGDVRVPSRDPLSLLHHVHITKEKEEADLRCSLCQEEFLEDDRASRLPCDHLFHPDCLQAWFDHSAPHRPPSCPQCKRRLTDFQTQSRASHHDSDLDSVSSYQIIADFSSDESSQLSPATSFSFGSENSSEDSTESD